MARPRKDENRIPVKQRLADALWAAMEKTPFEEIRVTELAHSADLNHNMIYYYYDGIEDMALDVLAAELADRSLQNALLSLVMGEQTEDAALLLVPPARRRKGAAAPRTISQKCAVLLLYARMDTATLYKAAFAAVYDGWLAQIGLTAEQLSEAEELQLRATLQGLFSVLGSAPYAKNPAALGAFLNSPFGMAGRTCLEGLLARTDRNPVPVDEAPLTEEPLKEKQPAAKQPNPVKATAKKPAAKSAAKKPATKKPAAKKPVAKPKDEAAKEAARIAAEEEASRGRDMEVWML